MNVILAKVYSDVKKKYNKKRQRKLKYTTLVNVFERFFFRRLLKLLKLNLSMVDTHCVQFSIRLSLPSIELHFVSAYEAGVGLKLT